MMDASVARMSLVGQSTSTDAVSFLYTVMLKCPIFSRLAALFVAAFFVVRLTVAIIMGLKGLINTYL
jgi:hypothetical protein